MLGNELALRARRFTPGLIPTGELATVESTPFVFTMPHTTGARIGQKHE